jgi:energy-coupling factor transporter transmembrane protein EcfT
MAVIVPLGNYFAGSSLLHRLDSRVKLLLLTGFLAGLFMVQSWLGLAGFSLLLLAAYLNAHLPPRLALRGLTPLIIILVFTILANAFGFATDSTLSPPLTPWSTTAQKESAESDASPSLTIEPTSTPLLITEPTPNSQFSVRSVTTHSLTIEPTSNPQLTAASVSPTTDPLLETEQNNFVPLIGDFGFKPAGFLRGVYLAIRIILLFSSTSLLTFTTALVALSDALVAMLRPLKALHVPTEDIAMVFSIALRFIVLTAQETEQIMIAQQVRGAVFNRGGPIRRAQAWLPVLVPLFVKLFRRADRLAAAMETRCYRGEGRTHLRAKRLKPQTILAALAAATTLVATGVFL